MGVTNRWCLGSIWGTHNSMLHSSFRYSWPCHFEPGLHTHYANIFLCGLDGETYHLGEGRVGCFDVNGVKLPTTCQNWAVPLVLLHMRSESPCHIWHMLLDLGDPVLTLFTCNLQLNVIVTWVQPTSGVWAWLRNWIAVRISASTWTWIILIQIGIWVKDLV